MKTKRNAKPRSNLRKGAQSRRQNQAIVRKGYLYGVSIYSAAEVLGCEASHLRRVIKGERQSPDLLARYQALKVA